MAYQTRKGTRVLHPGASAMAASYEIIHDADEYVCYRYFKVDTGNRLFVAEPPDHLLVRNSEIEGMAHCLNLVNGMWALISWNELANTVKPFSL